MAVGALTKAFGALMVSASTGWLAVVGPWLAVVGVIAFLYLLVDDFVAWVQGRPSVIGYLLKDIDWPMLQDFRAWMKDVLDFVFSSNEGSIFDLWKKDLEFIVYYLKKVDAFFRSIPGINFMMPGGVTRFGAGVSAGTPQSASPLVIPERFRGPPAPGSGGTVTQTISPVINVNVTKPGSTADDIVSVLRRETAKIFGDAAYAIQPPFAQ
jgi:hypothetical protein